ncbi:MAG: lysophospholipid acyltransferase family protein [Chthonomonas sp.]|nr:lysophospholipid acyltransferase family protein [Chthonomonas sp.]
MADQRTWKDRRRDIEGKLSFWAFRRAQRWLGRKQGADRERTGEKLGRMLFRASKKHRERAYRNFRLAFPEMSQDAMQALAQRVFEHYGRTTADFLTSQGRTKEQIDAMVTVEGREHIQAAIDRGKGTLFITAHFGNWELLAQWMAFNGYPLHVIARDVRNKNLNDAVNAIRLGPGTKVLSRGNAARAILGVLKENGIVGILPDQNETELFIPLFGHTAGTVLGPGVIHARTDATVVAGYCAYEAPGKYRIIFEPPLTPEPGYETRGEGLMRAIHTSLEEMVRRYPEQWLWFHDRWKSARQRGLVP